MPIKIVPLGAGQDVGRSCIIAEVGGRAIMLDCGIHMVDHQKFPDFSFLYGGSNNVNLQVPTSNAVPGHAQTEANHTNLDLTHVVDAVLVTHFHLDHIGALPYFTEAVGYSGPIIATPPTKAIIPLMLEDFRKVSVAQKGEVNCFSSEMIKNCISKISTIQLHETMELCNGEIKVTAYYAGHVLGGCMFYVECNGESLVYTGDYNMSADRHLGAAWIDKLRPDVVLTETTYATTIRDSKRSREREFLK